VYSFYADESGIANIHDARQWYVFLAVGLDDANWKRIDDAVLAVKRRHFPGWEPHRVEIHSGDIRRANRETYPPNPFSTLPPEQLLAFTDDLYGVIDNAPLQWCVAGDNYLGRLTTTILAG
jgi:hypothetical protein